MAVNAVVVLAAAALTLLLPRRPRVRQIVATEERATEFSASRDHPGVMTTLRAEFSAAFLKTS